MIQQQQQQQQQQGFIAYVLEHSTEVMNFQAGSSVDKKIRKFFVIGDLNTRKSWLQQELKQVMTTTTTMKQRELKQQHDNNNNTANIVEIVHFEQSISFAAICQQNKRKKLSTLVRSVNNFNNKQKEVGKTQFLAFRTVSKAQSDKLGQSFNQIVKNLQDCGGVLLAEQNKKNESNGCNENQNTDNKNNLIHFLTSEEMEQEEGEKQNDDDEFKLDNAIQQQKIKKKNDGRRMTIKVDDNNAKKSSLPFVSSESDSSNGSETTSTIIKQNDNYRALELMERQLVESKQFFQQTFKEFLQQFQQQQLERDNKVLAQLESLSQRVGTGSSLSKFAKNADTIRIFDQQSRLEKEVTKIQETLAIFEKGGGNSKNNITIRRSLTPTNK